MPEEILKTQEDPFSRTRMLIGQEGLDVLSRARVAVFGIGGVGGYVCEALVRSGVGRFDLIDMDTVSVTNLNRQIIATYSSMDRPKTEVMKERMLDINPHADIRVHNCFFLPDNADTFDFTEYQYVVDAVDTVTAKIAIILRAQSSQVPVISSMGAGNKLDPSRFRAADISETRVCPLAKVMRRELKKRGVEHLKVVFSDEPPLHLSVADPEVPGRHAPGSVMFTPAAAGLVIASEVVKDLIRQG